MTDERKHDLSAIALLLLITCVLFADVIAGNSVFFFRDFSRYYFPVKKVQRDIVLAGEFPSWTRAYGGGQPLAANPEHETFYPLNWLILLPDYVGALHWQALLHLGIALVGMYAFLRSLRLRAFASFIGALSFGLGGPMLSKINMAPFLYSMAWLPLTCLFARRFLIDGTRRAFALAALCLGLQMLIGEPTTVMQTVALIGGYSIWQAYRSKRPAFIGRAMAIGIASVLLAAVQIVPAIDFVRDSARSRGFELDIVGQWSMPFVRLLELAYPNVFGHHFFADTTVFWGTRLYDTTSIPFLFSIYPGLLITALAIAGLFARRAGAGIMLFVCAAAIVIAAGKHTPLLGTLYDLGLIRTLRYPEKFVVAAILAMTIFAAQCLDGLADDQRLRRYAIAVGAFLTAIPAAFFLWSGATSYASAFSRVFDVDAQATAFAVEISRNDWLIAVLQGCLVLAVAVVAAWPPHSRWVMALATVAMLADIGRLSPEVTPTLPSTLYEKPNVPAVLWNDRFRLFHQAEFSPRREGVEGVRPRMRGIRFRDVPSIQFGYRNGLFPHFSAAWGLPTVLEHDVDATNLLATIDFRRAVETAAGVRGDRAIEAAMAMSNARFRAVLRTPPPTKDVMRVQPVAFVETTRQPRYYFGDPVVRVRDVDEFTARLGSPEYGPSVAFVTQPLTITGTGVVRSVSETSNGATIDADANGTALLVMSVTPHRYWSVHVDGVAAPPLVTNVGYQGVVVPPGRHRVTMTYRNPVVVWSAVVSAVMLLILMWLSVTPRTGNALT